MNEAPEKSMDSYSNEEIKAFFEAAKTTHLKPWLSQLCGEKNIPEEIKNLFIDALLYFRIENDRFPDPNNQQDVYGFIEKMKKLRNSLNKAM